jgi:hypothetical protein
VFNERKVFQGHAPLTCYVAHDLESILDDFRERERL